MIKNQEETEIYEMLKRRFAIEEIIEKIKKSCRDENIKIDKDIKILSLFVLEVGVLESWLKSFNAMHCLGTKEYKKYFDETTLGRAIDDFERCGKFKNAKHFLIQKLLNERYKKSFIGVCKHVKDLRNNLYHNLYSKSLNLKSLLNRIRKRVEINKILYEIECKDLGNHKTLIKKGELSDNWTIEMLIYILIRYYIPNKF